MISLLHRHIVPAALALLPSQMDTPAARALLLAIALQESGGRRRRQMTGPARGFWQFEIAGVRGVLWHRASKPHLATALARLAYPVTDDATVSYVAIEHNDILACCVARLLLWTDPHPLPGREDVAEAYEVYIRTWQPGRPHPDPWAAHVAEAWRLVEP